MVPLPPAIASAVAVKVAVAVEPEATSGTVPMFRSLTTKATVPAGALATRGDPDAAATVAVNVTVSDRLRLAALDVSVVVLGLPLFHSVTRRKASAEPRPVARS